MKLRVSITLSLLCLAFVCAVLPKNVLAQETLIWSQYVYSDGSPVTSPVLEAGREYRIVAKEIFWYNLGSNLAADAQYYTTDSSNYWVWGNYFAPEGGQSFLQINGQSVYWGPFSNGIGSGSWDGGHTYSIDYIGEGSSIVFALVDVVDGNPCNNYCHLPVEIWEKPLCSGYTPGFWKHNIGVALGYSKGDYSAFNDGTKLTEEMLLNYAATVGVTLQEAYDAVSAKGNTAGQAAIRADMANAFNAAAGYGPFID